jgi:hypothetical protein
MGYASFARSIDAVRLAKSRSSVTDPARLLVMNSSRDRSGIDCSPPGLPLASLPPKVGGSEITRNPDRECSEQPRSAATPNVDIG